MLVEPGSFSEITAVIDGSHVPREEGVRCRRRGTAETADMARLAEPPALALLPQGYPLTISCPVSDLCVQTQQGLLSHSFYLELEESLKSLQAV